MKSSRKAKKMWGKFLCSETSPYETMACDTDSVPPKKEEPPAKPQPQSNLKWYGSAADKDVKKEKKKRKGWKRFRHIALLTCRYIGMGVGYMSPISTYPADYNVDPVWWYDSVQGRHTTAPHWTTGIIVNSW